MSEPKNSPSSSSPGLLPEPCVDGVLDNVPGGEPNLLPEAKTHDDLKVWFELWEHSNPMLGDESVELFFDDVSVDIRSWRGAPIEASDRFVTLPKQRLRGNDGQHGLSYKVTAYNDGTDVSSELVITLDTIAPLLAPSSQLQFPSEVLPPNQLTAWYLERDDQLQAKLPVYTDPKPGDHIVWYWGESPGDLNQGDVINLDHLNYLDPVIITVSGELIRDRGDGWRYVSYKVWDRAGNPSVQSEPVELDVAATPIPRELPWPSVENASGTGGRQTLNPLQFTSGAIVEIPDTAGINPGEKVWVQWGDPDSVGEYRTTPAIPLVSRRYPIPMKSIAAYIGKTLPVSYVVIDAQDEEWPSAILSLTVQSIPSEKFPTVQCNGLSGGRLSVSSVAAEGAKLTIDTWPLMTTDHWIMIRMTGIGSPDTFEAIRKRAVTDQEVIRGIGAGGTVRVNKAFLNSLRRNEPLTGNVYVSFDGGQTWPPLAAPNFPQLQLTLVD